MYGLSIWTSIGGWYQVLNREASDFLPERHQPSTLEAPALQIHAFQFHNTVFTPFLFFKPLSYATDQWKDGCGKAIRAPQRLPKAEGLCVRAEPAELGKTDRNAGTGTP